MEEPWIGRNANRGLGTNFALLLYRGVKPKVAGSKEKDVAAVREVARGGNEVLGRPESRNLHQALVARQAAMLEVANKRGEKTWSKPYRVAWRMIVGSSYGKVLDAGLQVHPLYGVPYIPATALKGATRHWARFAGAEEGLINEVFGTQRRRGAVTFYDTYCQARLVPGGEDCRRPFLVEDVMAPHYRRWYEAELGPGEWEEPTPVKLLAIRKGVRLQLCLSSWDEDPLKTASGWVEDCMKWYGMGAKTRKNYGRLSESK